MRVLRVLLGVVAILVALPLLLGGVTLWAAMQHRADDGSFTAPLAPIHTGGDAVGVPPLGAPLPQGAPVVPGGGGTLRPPPPPPPRPPPPPPPPPARRAH